MEVTIGLLGMALFAMVFLLVVRFVLYCVYKCIQRIRPGEEKCEFNVKSQVYDAARFCLILLAMWTLIGYGVSLIMNWISP